jgi:D-Tyr-tRNAtyr deacylase
LYTGVAAIGLVPDAAPPAMAEELYEVFAQQLRTASLNVATASLIRKGAGQ